MSPENIFWLARIRYISLLFADVTQYHTLSQTCLNLHGLSMRNILRDRITLICLTLSVTLSASHGVSLNFVSFSVGFPGAGYNPLVIEPTFALVLEEMRERYPRLFRNYTWIAKSSLNESACTVGGQEVVVDALVSLLAEEAVERPGSQTIFLAPRKFIKGNLVCTNPQGAYNFCVFRNRK